MGFIFTHLTIRVYNNNFINNKKQPTVYFSRGNIFNLPLPTGENYWNDFDTPEERCYDLNKDNICDSPYIFILLFMTIKEIHSQKNFTLKSIKIKS